MTGISATRVDESLLSHKKMCEALQTITFRTLR